MARILIVEDDPNQRLLYQEGLRSEEYEILTARDGREALDTVEKSKPDLVVMDIVAFTRRESMLRLRDTLVAVEKDRLSGKKGFSIDDIDEMMKKTIMKVADGQHK